MLASKGRALLLIFVLLVVLLRPARPAIAQSGQCPSWPVGVLTTPQGTYPTATQICIANGQFISVVGDPSDWYPCDQHLFYDAIPVASVVNPIELWVAPPMNDDLDSFIRVRLYWIPQELILPVSDGAYDSYKITFIYYNSSNAVISTLTEDLPNYPHLDSTHGSFPSYFYRAYLIDQIITTSPGETNGYIKIVLSRDFNLLDPTTWSMADGRISSIQIGRYQDHTFPNMCPVPNSAEPLPNTPTPRPTWTPYPTPAGATDTPTPLPITPYATSPGSTPTVATIPTVTPWVFPTILAEYTPTPWPPYDIPTVEWPTRDLTIVQAAATVISQTTGLDALGDSINSAWSTPLALSGDAMDTTITQTTGYGAPTTLVMSVTQGLALPISYGKAVADVLPNFGPYLAGLLTLAALIVFNHIAKFSIQVAVFIFELLRKLWQALPLT